MNDRLELLDQHPLARRRKRREFNRELLQVRRHVHQRREQRHEVCPHLLLDRDRVRRGLDDDIDVNLCGLVPHLDHLARVRVDHRLVEAYKLRGVLIIRHPDELRRRPVFLHRRPGEVVAAGVQPHQVVHNGPGGDHGGLLLRLPVTA